MAVNIARVEQLCELASYCTDEIVPCFVGAPGIGKTDGVRRWSEASGKKLTTIIASQCYPQDIAGMDCPDQDTKTLRTYDPEIMSNLDDDSILFFDELLKAPEVVLSACLTLIQSREMKSGRKLPGGLQILAATNHIPNPQRIPKEIRQRFIFFPVQFNKGAWQWYMKEKMGVKLAFSKEVVDRIPDVCNEPRAVDYNDITPRTATKIIKWMKAVPPEKKSDLFDLLLQAYPGDFVNACASALENEIEETENKQPVIDQEEYYQTAVKQLADNYPAFDIAKHVMPDINGGSRYFVSIVNPGPMGQRTTSSVATDASLAGNPVPWLDMLFEAIDLNIYREDLRKAFK